MPRLHELIAEHGAAPFPPSVGKGCEYGEVDAVMIGADIYGWALQARDGGLSSTDRDRLKAARAALAGSINAFPTEAQAYYSHLIELADAALE